MRTYGIDTKSGNWTLLTTTPITGASNPLVSEINSVFNTNSRITSTLYTALITFTIGSSVINNNDLLQNDVITDNNGNVLYNSWQDITQGFTLISNPLPTSVAIQQGGFNSFLANYGLTAGEEIIVDPGYIWLATLAQTLRLNTNESPFYANYGIAAEQSVQTQIAPTIDITRTQQQYAPYFSSLTIFKQPNTVNPTYNVTAVFLNGTTIQSVIAT
jgi:hypothetical protein